VTGAPPEAPPPSDTIERLPDDFWGSEALDAEPTDVAPSSARGATPTDAPRDAAPAAVGAVEPPSDRAPGSGVAVLQRLFPGRVLGVEPRAGDTIDAGDDPAVVATADDDARDQAPDEGGLESDRSRR